MITTAASCGAVNAMHDSFFALGGYGAEVADAARRSGVRRRRRGAGMLLFVVLAVFIAGLMIGRSPEYLGKKIEVREMKLIALAMMSEAGPRGNGESGPARL
ncbi:Potassium-transporting ATPase A chain|nr:Potassium-transporting ATPase A chain [Candidatus Pantoea persica]